LDQRVILQKKKLKPKEIAMMVIIEKNINIPKRAKISGRSAQLIVAVEKVVKMSIQDFILELIKSGKLSEKLNTAFTS